MWKSCSKCGRVHDTRYICRIPNPRKTRTEDQRLRSTKRWTKKSEEIREKSQHLCAICREEGRYTYENLEVHHIEKLKDNAERLLDNYNLIALCKYHHELADEGKIDRTHLEELARLREDAEVPPTTSVGISD